MTELGEEQMTLVVKLGGNEEIDPTGVLDDLALLCRQGVPAVLVHGGSGSVDKLYRALGKEPRYITSASGRQSRYTDAEAIGIFTMAMAGQVRPDLVTELQRRGVRAWGLSGIDGGIVRARRKEALKVRRNGRIFVVRDDMSGIIQEVNPHPLKMLLEAGYLPVIGPPVLGMKGDLLNVDGDRLAQALAVALNAQNMVIISAVPGLLRDPNDESSLVGEVPLDDMDQYLPLARGRMITKLESAREALTRGVDRVVLGGWDSPHPLLDALRGKGTVITRSRSVRRLTVD